MTPYKFFYRLKVVTIFLFILFSSCRNKNYIHYYQEVNRIDSIYRFEKDTLKTITEYRKLFRQYMPKNQERIMEFETYITLSDQYNKDFGGKRMLRRLVYTLSPYGSLYEKYFPIYTKYGMDSVAVRREVVKWKKKMNRRLVDSFSVAFARSQQGGRLAVDIRELNDKKNAELLKWTFKKYGFPSVHKIGIMTNDNTFMPMDNFLGNMIETEDFPFLLEKTLEAVKSGDCPPRIYALMVDKHNYWIAKKKQLYWGFMTFEEEIDTLQINKNRKSIGLPSIGHSMKITEDYFKKNK